MGQEDAPRALPSVSLGKRSSSSAVQQQTYSASIFLRRKEKRIQHSRKAAGKVCD
ncbi:hypothetical protein JOB18_026685 [Solea senegalensis]|uniref:Uncharacterized protein n=1 Tax=Solea senegalensis TaxID=28829 RepID=A0AAV6QD06_SOLSE|nr:hypothetical protein JOB18_026685 [Solea senegalensis]